MRCDHACLAQARPLCRVSQVEPAHCRGRPLYVEAAALLTGPGLQADCYLQIRPNGAASPPVPSFLSIDVDARVLRLDSMSKIVAPGSRLGFITGPRPLLERVMLGKEAMGANPSGLSVAVVASVLRAWGGHEGFENNYLPHISCKCFPTPIYRAGLR